MKIFVDGQEGTTGLEILARLKKLPYIQVLRIDPKFRKSVEARKDLLNQADIAVLCLPDKAAKEAITLLENPDAKIIDASTCHRVSEGWTYGFPEYRKNHREIIRKSRFISNPGCYAIAAVSILYPLIEKEILPNDWPVSITGLSGYSGGGKSLIEKFEKTRSSEKLNAYDYALNLSHKHLPEISKWTGLERKPTFLPCVGNFYRGMLVRIPIPLWALPRNFTEKDLFETYSSHYAGNQFLQIDTTRTDLIDPEELNGTNRLTLHILYDRDSNNSMIVAQLDNLGRGASGQVIQIINIISGNHEETGL